jgi:heparan-alpha-glucosaminide N-acetyltransferase
MGISRNLWYTLSITGFILIWNQYPAQWPNNYKAVLRISGGVLLSLLALQYKGGEDGGTIEYFQPHWWGILGLIGWAYLASGLVTIFARDRIAWICVAWVFFALLSMVYHAHWVPSFLSFIPATILGGTETGLAMGGVLTALVFQYYHQEGASVRMTLLLLGFTVLLTVLSILTRPYWGLAKLGATPAWLFLCSAFTIWLFLIVYWVAEVYQKSSWFKVVLPAGSDTLLTYFIPYYAYAFKYLIGWHWPSFLLEGAVGLVKSFLFALLCVWMAKNLSRLGIKLKL